MEDLKNKNFDELLKDMTQIIEYLETHNKNYTKKQYYSILDLKEISEELKNRFLVIEEKKETKKDLQKQWQEIIKKIGGLEKWI